MTEGRSSSASMKRRTYSARPGTERSTRPVSKSGSSRAIGRQNAPRVSSADSQWSISPMSPCSRTTGSPSPRSSHRKREGARSITSASLSRSHVDALPIVSKESIRGPELDLEMERQLPNGPGPVRVGARAAGQERPAQVARVASLEASDGAADIPDVVRIAARRHREHELEVAQRGPGVVGRGEEAGVVDRLDGVEREVADHLADRGVAAAHTAQRMKWMGRDGEPTLVVNDLDGLERREAGRHELLEEETQEVAVESTDLLAHHDVDAELRAGERPLPSAERSADLVVIRDGDDVEAPLDGIHDLLGALRTVAPHRVHVQVGAALGTCPHREQVWRGCVNRLLLCT